MDGFAALMTKNFHDSNWTDQEIGFALGRGVMVIAVNLGRNPYGFIGDMQALKTSWAKSCPADHQASAAARRKDVRAIPSGDPRLREL